MEGIVERGYHVASSGHHRGKGREERAVRFFRANQLHTPPPAHHQSNTGELVPWKSVAHAINLAVDDV